MTLNGQLSTAIVQMVQRVQPSVVQIMSGSRGSGAGAGIIWHSKGRILTNHHVVANKGAIEVLLPDGRRFDAKVTNRNPTLDLALLQLETIETIDTSDLPAALVDDSSKLRIGELVFAIGHPWGQRDTLTTGIVSGLGTMQVGHNGQRVPYIRSDVALAPGNSGGPLLNANGAVIGINAMIFGGDQSVAIPSHVASQWVAGLPSRRVSLGVKVQPVQLPSTVQQGAWANRATGLLVTGLSSTHHKTAILMIGDVLLDIDGNPLNNPESLSDTLGRHRSTDQIQLHILRGGAIRELEVSVGNLEQTL